VVVAAAEASAGSAVDGAAGAAPRVAGELAAPARYSEERHKDSRSMTMRTLGHRLVRIAALVAVLGFGSACSYNTFTTQEEAIKAQWAQVENQLQRRNDLIPNLVETVKGFAQQEKDVFQAVADARAKMAGATNPTEKIAAANAESSALARLLVVVEAYPQLKSNESFNNLMFELTGTENRLATERMRYNEKILAYNTQRRKFPSNVTAGIFGFKEYPYFEAPGEAKVAPKVDFKK
jgi:LemA protein